MAKVKIELDLDWLQEDESLDERIKEEVISGLQDRFTVELEKKAIDTLNAKLQEVATKVTDAYIEKVLEAKIADISIPYKEERWNSTFKLVPLSEFIGMEYEKFLTKKTLTSDGSKPRYSDDARLSISEYFIHNYLEKELSGKVSAMIQTARKDAEETIVKALENNLKEQLSVDIIQRLNIPKMLESLQSKAAELGSDSE